jgi:hypothetical protein
MTEEQIKIAANFEARVRQLMFLCDRLKLANADLEVRLAAQQVSNESLREENANLNTKYNTLMMARIISVKQDDLKGAKNRLSKLVREVDKCIALLNG